MESLVHEHMIDVALVAETIEWIERDGGANAPQRMRGQQLQNANVLTHAGRRQLR